MSFCEAVFGVVLCVAVGGFSLSAKAAQLGSGGQTEIAALSSARALRAGVLHMDVKSSCTAEGTLFEITNRGEEWPQRGFIGLYFTNNGSLFDSRRMRFAAGQKASFVVSKAVSRGRSLGLWIDPRWYYRKFSLDGRAACK